MPHNNDHYEDCASCVFRGREPAICDECDDADQWEPDEDFVDEMQGLKGGCERHGNLYGERGRKIYKHYKLKKAA